MEILKAWNYGVKQLWDTFVRHRTGVEFVGYCCNIVEGRAYKRSSVNNEKAFSTPVTRK